MTDERETGEKSKAAGDHGSDGRGERSDELSAGRAGSEETTATLVEASTAPAVRRPGGRLGLPALALYGLLAFLFFGLRLVVEPGSRYLGPIDDPQIFIWSFAWWPHALAHGMNPFVTHQVWAPSGIDLAWATSVPGLSLLFAPLTALLGPVVAYDVAAVVMPAIAAWTAFLLCRRLTGALWPSLVGGYLFGFSSYEIGQTLGGHLNLSTVFTLPLVALVLHDAVQGRLAGRRLALRLGALLAFGVLTSTELTFALGLLGTCALLLAFVLVPAARPGLRRLPAPLLGAGVVALVITSPFLAYMLTDFHSETFNRPEAYVADVLNLVVPTHWSLAGWRWTGWLRFRGNDAENGAFIGIPALLIVLLFALRHLRTAGGRFLLACLALALLIAFGQLLTFNGKGVVELPWRYVVDLPLFDNLLTSRVMVFVELVVAVVVALWTAAQRSAVGRFALPALAILMILPDLAIGDSTRYTIPRFFTDRLYRSCLDRDENVLTLPILNGSQSKLWQVASGFRFRLTGGGVAPLPPEPFEHPYPIQYIAMGYPPAPQELAWLRRFIREKQVSSVIVDFSERETWQPLMDRIATGQESGGIVLYHLSSTAPACLAG